MTITDYAVHELVDRFLRPLDWMHASWIVNDALAPLVFLNTLMERVLDVPVLGAIVMDIFIALGVIEALLGAVLTLALVVGSSLLFGVVTNFGLSLAHCVNTIEAFARLVC